MITQNVFIKETFKGTYTLTSFGKKWGSTLYLYIFIESIYNLVRRYTRKLFKKKVNFFVNSIWILGLKLMCSCVSCVIILCYENSCVAGHINVILKRDHIVISLQQHQQLIIVLSVLSAFGPTIIQNIISIWPINYPWRYQHLVQQLTRTT